MADVKNNYSFIRVAPCTNANRGAGSLGKALGHLDNHKESADISKEELSHLNKCFVKEPKSYKECIELAKQLEAKNNSAVDEYNAKHGLKGKKAHRHMKQGTYQFFEGVMTYSPDMQDSIDVDKWSQASYEFLKREYEDRGCEIIRCDLHCDESSIHMQFVVACFDNSSQSCSYRNIIGGKASLSQLQDRYGEAMEPFGLVRGFSRYRENYALKEAAAEYYNTTVEKLTKPQWLTWCEMHKVEPKKSKQHEEISKWKAEQLNKQEAERLAEIEAKYKQKELALQEKYNDAVAKLKADYKAKHDKLKANYDAKGKLFVERSKALMDDVKAKINNASAVLEAINSGDIEKLYDILNDNYRLAESDEVFQAVANALDEIDSTYQAHEQAKKDLIEVAKSFVCDTYLSNETLSQKVESLLYDSEEPDTVSHKDLSFDEEER